MTAKYPSNTNRNLLIHTIRIKRGELPMAMAIDKKPINEVKLDSQDPEKVKARLLAKYPPKVARKRAKQIVVNKVGSGRQVPR
jgi:hypothetical protein